MLIKDDQAPGRWAANPTG